MIQLYCPNCDRPLKETDFPDPGVECEHCHMWWDKVYNGQLPVLPIGDAARTEAFKRAWKGRAW